MMLKTESSPSAAHAPDMTIPVYRIDLSLPPFERYAQLGADFGSKMRALAPLFDDVLSIIPNDFLRNVIRFLARIFLRRVYSWEETQEIRGISAASGVDMFLLVALNVLLDSLLGCTSGGVMTRPASGPDKAKRMMHFRTLDWGMDGLRDLIVVLEFVRSSEKDPNKVIARCVTYAGFTGILTGVREGLSISLNFRPTHTSSTFKLRTHQLFVILGLRPSIASNLRSTLWPCQQEGPGSSSLQTLASLTEVLANTRSAPCYLILCDGSQTTVIEKDLNNGRIRTAQDFIVHTNHDTSQPDFEEGNPQQQESTTILGMETLVEESKERRYSIQRRWDIRSERHGDSQNTAPTIKEETLRRWIQAYPIMNECTHFACILDQKTGEIRWLERGFIEP